MTTLVITENFPPKVGGSGRWFWEIYSRLPRDKYIIAAGADLQSESFDKTHNLQCLRWPLTLSTWGIASLNGFSAYFKLFRLLRSIIKEREVTAIHCGRCLPEGLLGLIASGLANIPYTCYVHGEEINTFHKSRELLWLSNSVFSGARQIIVNTQNTGRLLSRYGSIRQNKIEVLHPGVDASFFKPAPPDAGIRKRLGWEGRKVLLTVGRLQKRKGHDHTIRSLRYIKESVPEILYAIIGEGEEHACLKEIVTDEDLGQYVHFLGKVDDDTLLECYQQSDAFILANREVDGDIEGFGMVLVEAQACGKPAIAGKSGGTAEAILPDETGILVDCTSPQLIAEAVIDLLREEKKRTVMGRNASTWARENYDWESLVRKAENIFSNV